MTLSRLAIVWLLASSPQQLLAQRGDVLGHVLMDGSERPVAGARIEIRPNGPSATSDSIGRFRLRNVEPGNHALVIRAVGFDSLVANVRLAPNDVIDLDFLLSRSAQTLAPVRVGADGSLVRIRISEFDDRRRLGFGRFLDSAVFTENAGRQIDDILSSRVPGVGIQRVGGKNVLVGRRSGTRCYAQIVVNGISVYNGDVGATDKASREAIKFDVTTLRADEVIGFEWHTPASTPLKYNATGSGHGAPCGTAIFWTK